MSGHRVEVKISFHVSDTYAREAAEAVIRDLEEVVTYSRVADYAHDFQVTPLTVDGNGWHEKWPPHPKSPTCDQYSAPRRLGGTLGPCVKDSEHEHWHRDASGATWAPLGENGGA